MQDLLQPRDTLTKAMIEQEYGFDQLHKDTRFLPATKVAGAIDHGLTWAVHERN